jgi:putative peptidoglycan lipid II flippase
LPQLGHLTRSEAGLSTDFDGIGRQHATVRQKIEGAPWLGAAGLALATSVGLTLYAALLFRTGRVRGFMRGPSVGSSTILIASGVVSALAIWWSRDLVLDLLATFVPSGALLAAFLFVVLTATAFHAVATILALRVGRSGS